MTPLFFKFRAFGLELPLPLLLLLLVLLLFPLPPPVGPGFFLTAMRLASGSLGAFRAFITFTGISSS